MVDFPITNDQFEKNLFPKPPQNEFCICESLTKAYSDKIFSKYSMNKQGAAAFLAHVSHETGELEFIKEQNPTKNYCNETRPYKCLAGKNAYYGRGPLQLRQNRWAPVRVRRNLETFCRSLTIRTSLSAALFAEGDPRVDGEPLVVVLAVDQAPGGAVALREAGTGEIVDPRARTREGRNNLGQFRRVGRSGCDGVVPLAMEIVAGDRERRLRQIVFTIPEERHSPTHEWTPLQGYSCRHLRIVRPYTHRPSRE